MQFLENRIQVMWNIDQCSLVSQGWPCGANYHIVHSLETNRTGPISRQILVLPQHNLFFLKGKGT